MLPPEQQASRELTGKALKVWFRQNNWSIQIPHDWASAVGSDGPWNSQISLFTRGKLDGKPNFFVSLGRFNRFIAAQDFTGIKERKLLDRIKGAEPFSGDDGAIWGPIEFFGAYVGELQPPEKYLSAAPELTEQDAIRISEELREVFRRRAAQEMLPPKQAFAQLAQRSELGVARQQRLQSILTGWDNLTLEDLENGLLQRAVLGWAADEPATEASQSVSTSTVLRSIVCGSTPRQCTKYQKRSPRTTTTARRRPLSLCPTSWMTRSLLSNRSL